MSTARRSVNLTNVPVNRLSTRAVTPSPRRTRLGAAAIDDALDLFALLMATRAEDDGSAEAALRDQLALR